MKAPLLLFCLAFILRLGIIIWWQFDGLYGQDAYAYWQQAAAIVANLPRGQLPPVDFFWPNGYPVLVALVMLLVGRTALAGQLASLLAGSLLPAVVYLLAVELWGNGRQNSEAPVIGRRAGLLAGLIVAVAGQPVLSSVVIMADIAALFWAALAAWGVVRAGHSPTPYRQAGWYVAAGASLALAITSRWIYILIVLALSLYAGLAWLRRQNRAAWWPPVGAVASGLLVLSPQLWLSLHRPDSLAHSWLVGWRPANFFQRQFENVDGHFIYRLPPALFYAQPAGHPAYIFPLLGLAAGWGVWLLWRDKRWSAALLLLGWAGPVYLFLAGIPYENFRFGLSLYLPLVLLAGFGLANLYHSIYTKIVITLSLLAMLLWSYTMLDSFLTTQNRTKDVALRVAQTLPADATVLTFGLTLTMQHYTRLQTLELFYQNEDTLAALLASPAPLYLLLDPGNVEQQWAGKTPQVNYAWLRQHAGLSQIASFSPYILYRVDRPVLREGS